jgi:hypothetical protein
MPRLAHRFGDPDQQIHTGLAPSERPAPAITDLMHLRRDGGAEIVITAVAHHLDPHYGLGSDITACRRSANKRHDVTRFHASHCASRVWKKEKIAVTAQNEPDPRFFRRECADRRIKDQRLLAVACDRRRLSRRLARFHQIEKHLKPSDDVGGLQQLLLLFDPD